MIPVKHTVYYNIVNTICEQGEQRMKKTKPILTKEFLYQEYVLNKKSAVIIARETGYGRNNIYHHLRKFGLKIRDTKKKTTNKYEKILTKKFLINEYINKKKSAIQIAKENGIKCGSTVNYHLDKFNIERRKYRPNYDELLNKEFLIEHYVKLGKTVNQMAEEFDLITQHNLVKALERHKIPRRRHKNGMIEPKQSRSKVVFGEIVRGWWYDTEKAAKDRNIVFNITPEYVWNLFIKQNKECSLTGQKLCFVKNYFKDSKNQTASLDRIDSTKGYIEGNVQWVHKKINFIKMHLPQDEFIELCKMVSSHCK